MKDLRDVKKEYGYVLRWVNGYVTDDGRWYPYRFDLEDVVTLERFEITNSKALDFISKKMTNAFRKDVNVYDNYVALFDILGIKKRGTRDEKTK